MENRNRFSGTLSLINRLNQNIAAVKFWSIFIGLCTKATWLISLFYFVFMTGQTGWSVDYLKMYAVRLVDWMQGKFNGNGVEISSWLVAKLQPMSFYEGLKDNDPQANLEALWMATTTHNIILASEVSFCAVGVLALCAWYFAHSEFKSQTGDKFKRGSLIMTAKQLSKELKRHMGAGVIWIGGVLSPCSMENLSYLLISAPQNGKTIILNRILSIVKARGNSKCVVWCPKPSDYISTHANFPADYVFAPSEDRSIRWSLGNDIVSMSDFDSIADILAPDKPGDKGAIWTPGGREIITGLLKFWWISDKNDRSNKRLWSIMNKTAREWQVMLQQTPGCGRAAGLLNNPESPTANSFYVTVAIAVKPLELLAKCDGDFSVRKYLSDKNDMGSIFLISTSRVKKMLAPVHTLFLEIMAINLLDMEQDRQRRVFFFLDEMWFLGRISRIEELLNVGPSFGFSALCGTQNLGKLRDIYGENGTIAIINACKTWAIGNVADDETAEALSKNLGKAEMEMSRQNYAISANEAKDSVTAMSETKDKVLVMPDEIKMLKPKQFYVRVGGFGCCKTTVDYVPYENKNPAWINDPEYDIDKMQIEYDALHIKLDTVIALASDSTSTEKSDTAEHVDISPPLEAVIDYNDARWQMAQVLTDEDDGICF